MLCVNGPVEIAIFGSLIWLINQTGRRIAEFMQITHELIDFLGMRQAFWNRVLSSK
jgi:hypothetical protein